MSNIIIAILAYLIDRKFGEFSFIKHPIVVIGELISFGEKILYKKSVFRGLLLVMFVLSIVSALAISLQLYLNLFLPLGINIIISAFIASMFIAHKMLRDSVEAVITAQNKKEAIAMLVSRDTDELSESDIYKAAVETYAENLSDGVIAPLFYLLLFGLPGIIIYKTINTMDSMIGYKNDKYEKFGKVAARLDDIANYIPSRITALLIMLVAKQKNPFGFYKDGSKHDSPNAGHPITAMALALGVKLGGDTPYFGKIKKKATFGEGKQKIEAADVQRALKLV
jgi:adenosylcobinamide-phosphate synthase